MRTLHYYYIDSPDMRGEWRKGFRRREEMGSEEKREREREKEIIYSYHFQGCLPQPSPSLLMADWEVLRSLRRSNVPHSRRISRSPGHGFYIFWIFRMYLPPDTSTRISTRLSPGPASQDYPHKRQSGVPEEINSPPPMVWHPCKILPRESQGRTERLAIVSSLGPNIDESRRRAWMIDLEGEV